MCAHTNREKTDLLRSEKIVIGFINSQFFKTDTGSKTAASFAAVKVLKVEFHIETKQTVSI